MRITQKVKKILSYYESDSPGTKTNLCRLLMNGKLAGTGNMIILPVDQGFEHGPDRSFVMNEAAYDPHYFFQLAIDAGLTAFAAPLGLLEAGADSFAGAIPTILKLNSSNSLMGANQPPYQAITSSVRDAVRLGCVAVGFTIYPGSDMLHDMLGEIQALSEEAKSYGLAVVIWSYPRGGELSKNGQTAVDVCAYAAHIAALAGAHIIKVKPPTAFVEQEAVKSLYAKHSPALGTAAERIRDGGGNGSIIGRNSFQRPRADALRLLDQLVKVYQGKL